MMIYCDCDSPTIDVERDAGCRRCGRPVNFAHGNTCPRCAGPVQVWADRSGGVTVNFACDNPRCPDGKAPWDTPRPRGEASR